MVQMANMQRQIIFKVICCITLNPSNSYIVCNISIQSNSISGNLCSISKSLHKALLMLILTLIIPPWQEIGTFISRWRFIVSDNKMDHQHAILCYLSTLSATKHTKAALMINKAWALKHFLQHWTNIFIWTDMATDTSNDQPTLVSILQSSLQASTKKQLDQLDCPDDRLHTNISACKIYSRYILYFCLQDIKYSREEYDRNMSSTAILLRIWRMWMG